MPASPHPVLLSDQAALELLLEASSALLAAPDLSSVLPRLLGVASELVAAHAHALWRYHGATGEWRILASSNLSESYLRGAAVPSAPGTALEPMFAGDVEQHPLLARRAAAYRAE